MTALCVDDEMLPLQALERAVAKSPDITETAAFTDELEAIEWAKSNKADIAFLDIELHEMNGIELAKKLHELQPDISVVFCTSYEQYALRAIKLHMDVGYLTKPCRTSQILDEIEYIKKKKTVHPKLKAVCFGNFDAFAEKKPLEFRRKKTKELLAYLIDRRGAEAGTGELCSVLWENDDDVRNRDYLYHLISDLKNSLASAGLEDVFKASNTGYSVDTELIDCDYYRYLKGEERIKRYYTGEYMHQYSWSEVTNAWLNREIVH